MTKTKEEIKQQKRVYYNKNKEKHSKRMKEYYKKNKDLILSKNKIYRENNKEAIRIQKIEYNKTDKAKSAHKKYRDSEIGHKNMLKRCEKYRKSKNAKKIKRKWQIKNKKSLAHYNKLRKMLILERVPLREDINKIKEFYKNCPDSYHVDHIFPLSKGGLHCIDNLQYLKAIDNLRKKDKILINMYNNTLNIPFTHNIPIDLIGKYYLA